MRTGKAEQHVAEVRGVGASFNVDQRVVANLERFEDVDVTLLDLGAIGNFNFVVRQPLGVLPQLPEVAGERIGDDKVSWRQS